MIKINLLPKKEVKKAAIPTGIGISIDILPKLVIPVGITILLVIAVFAYMEITKSGLKKDMESNKKKLAELQQKIEEVKKMEHMNKEIEVRTKIIEDLKKMQSYPLMLLNTVSKKLSEGVWLTDLTYDNKAVSLEGIAFSNLNIVAFVDNLKSVTDFQNVNLVESQQTEFDNVPVYKFVIKFEVKG